MLSPRLAEPRLLAAKEGVAPSGYVRMRFMPTSYQLYIVACQNGSRAEGLKSRAAQIIRTLVRNFFTEKALYTVVTYICHRATDPLGHISKRY